MTLSTEIIWLSISVDFRTPHSRLIASQIDEEMARPTPLPLIPWDDESCKHLLNCRVNYKLIEMWDDAINFRTTDTAELTVIQGHTGKSDTGDVQNADPVEPNGEPARRGEHQEPGAAVEILLLSEHHLKGYFRLVGPQCRQADQRRADVGVDRAASCNICVRNYELQDN